MTHVSMTVCPFFFLYFCGCHLFYFALCCYSHYCIDPLFSQTEIEQHLLHQVTKSCAAQDLTVTPHLGILLYAANIILMTSLLLHYALLLVRPCSFVASSCSCRYVFSAMMMMIINYYNTEA